MSENSDPSALTPHAGAPMPTPEAPLSAASAAIARVLARPPSPQPLPTMIVAAAELAHAGGALTPPETPSSVFAEREKSDASARTPLITAPPAKLDHAPGPITLKSRAFFNEAQARGAEKSDSLPFPPPQLVPLPKRSSRPKLDHVEVSGGVLVIERRSTAWIATAVAVVLGAGASIALGLDRESANEALVKSQAEVASLTTQIKNSEAAELARVQAAAAAPVVAPAKHADAGDVRAEDAARTKPIAEALSAAFTKELTRGDAQVVVDGPRVKLVLDGGLLFDPKKTSLATRANDVLARLGPALKPIEHRIDVVAHIDAMGRGKSEWAQSSARATIIVRALESAGVDARWLAAVGRGAAEPLGKTPAANRRVEIIVATR